MHHRIEVATDVAKIGAWDASGAAEPFYIAIGADWGGAVDVYVDQPVPDAGMARGRKVAKEGVVSVPSGRLVIAGGEDYRATAPRTTGRDSVLDVPQGDYRVRCYTIELDESDEASSPSVRDAEATLPPDDLLYYHDVDRAETRVALMGYALFLLFPILLFPFGWKIALAATALVVFAYFSFSGNRAERRRKADERWQRINKRVQDAFLRGQRAPLVIDLFPVVDHPVVHTRGVSSHAPT